jgi:hypothetical protein
MKNTEAIKRRRHIYITDENYKKVAAAAVEANVNKWIIIDEALAIYFSKGGK